MSLYKNLRGIIGNILQWGINGPQIKNNGGHFDFRNADDTGFVNARAAAPIDDNDVATLKFVKTKKGIAIVSEQADTSLAIPNNTAANRVLVVTTPGNGAAIGDLLHDNGSAVGIMEILTAIEGQAIAITDALVGGQITFTPDSIYVWDEDGGSWIKIGDIGSVGGALRIVDFPITNAASQQSTDPIPDNAIVYETELQVGTAFSAGATIAIGKTGSTSLLMATNENHPQAPNSEWNWQRRVSFGTAGPVLVTVGNAPAAGSGRAIVKFAVPLS